MPTWARRDQAAQHVCVIDSISGDEYERVCPTCGKVWVSVTVDGEVKWTCSES